MSYQRRRGQFCTVYPMKLVTDARGNVQWTTDKANPIQTRAFFVPTRASLAEVAGQLSISEYSMIVTTKLEGVRERSIVEWNDRTWEIVTPPEYHHGTPGTRHWSFGLRRRPD